MIDIEIFITSEFVEDGELIEGNDDLFWAVMGGSPGNYGILTHVRIRPLHDKDYPDSRMMKFSTSYTPEKHWALQTILAEMSSDLELPRNLDYALTIMGSNVPNFAGARFFDMAKSAGMHFLFKLCLLKVTITGRQLNEDEEMMHRHGEEYGDGVVWAEEGSGSFFHLMEGNVPASILNRPQNSSITVYVKVR